MSPKKSISIFWFRRDLRLHDNAGLYHALKNEVNLLPVFIFDPVILDQLENKQDRRVEFIHEALKSLHKQLLDLGSSLLVIHKTPLEAFKSLQCSFTIKNVYTNHDYEPYAVSRDTEVRNFLEGKNISFHSFKDQVIFESNEVLKDDGKPYTIFTPYMKKWKSKLSDFFIKSYPTENYFFNFLRTDPFVFPTLEEIGFESCGQQFAPINLNEKLIKNYDQTRNFPSVEGTSRMSVRLRFGTVSVRELATKALRLNDQWLNELIWREFYMMILFHFPHVVTRSFKPSYDSIKWINDENQFEQWCKGETGYPIVDAGMRELNSTGFMHNRVRMIVASFLVKHLLIDWRWGEAYFAGKLLDYDLSANNGGWQWAASSGCDAAPYFRIFNPSEQTKRFDSELKYIRKWVPELDEREYPSPIVEHKFARERVLAAYKKALQKS
ncbi:MAG: DNA photolyase family protein [Bacteroidota bacterium]|nr:DNA photolyase family protein [Bacteroidota bacterium]